MKRVISDELYAKAKENGIYPRRLYDRIMYLGWDEEKAATTPINAKRQAWKHGDSLYKAIKNGISKRTFYARLELGWSYEMASTKPLGKQGKRYDENGELKEIG
ncbi:hypothetical protein [Bacillus bingmayongensis]|uniref:hypothetical protein n=1 Tax=Bacillus bingmayongensis TaxID=1150157 RepID=UPI001C8E6D47|nr:hypothetical protein [Bacillus bingmayongensis]MBY0597720.1 hypothetical protein [Bacillus bingmayongensis]